MKLSDISHIRLACQHISSSRFTTPKEVVSWMGAMQAQDFAMAKWAIGVRLPGSTENEIASSYNNGEVLRTHLLRPTWHFVTAEDIFWLLVLTGPQINTSLKTRNKQLELTQEVLKKTNSVLEKALKGGNHLTREELIKLLNEAKINTNENRASHIFLQAEVDGIICSGKMKGSKLTYAFFEERVPVKIKLKKEEALSKLALKYFNSHGPATIKDFTWWSGLLSVDAKLALEMVKSRLVSVTVDGETYWFNEVFSDFKLPKHSIFLLPAFDEFLISYKNREASIGKEDHKKAISDNGIFRPFILENGKVIGIWKRISKKNSIALELNFFNPQGKIVMKFIEKAITTYSQFLNKRVGLEII